LDRARHRRERERPGRRHRGGASRHSDRDRAAECAGDVARLEPQEVRFPAAGEDRSRARERGDRVRTRRAMASRRAFRGHRLARLFRPRRFREPGAASPRAGWKAHRDERRLSVRGAGKAAGLASRGRGARAQRAEPRCQAPRRRRRGGLMGRIYVVANQKGGVGKTSIAVNLAASLAHYGRRVLLVDLDPQGNATTGSGIDKTACELTVYGVLLGEHDLAAATRPCEGGYDVVPSNRELAGAEVELIAIERREYRLRDALAKPAEGYDFVVIDCPPALNMLTVNGFAAADAVIIPMQCEYYALEGLSDLVGTLRKVKQNLNPRI